MATIKEIAKACNVSVATVSNILNDKPGASAATRKNVMAMIEKMNYTPNVVAKNLKLQKTRSIGVIAEDTVQPLTKMTPSVSNVVTVRAGLESTCWC